MRSVRDLPVVLGASGGLVGVGVHAVLLALFLSRPYGPFQAFLELLLAVLVGLAALALAAMRRTSTATLAVFLPVMGLLGFFPRPLTWIPAGVLLLAGGVAAHIVQRQTRDMRVTIRPGTVMGPDGRPLHWSEAARLGIPTTPAVPAAGPPPRPWSRGGKAAAAFGTVLATAAVITFSLGTITLDQEATGATVTTATVTPATVTALIDTPTDSVIGSTTTAAPADEEEFAWYTDKQYGFTIKFPRVWRNTDPTEVGQRMHRQSAELYTETFVPAAFADWNSPTFNGCYLDYIWIEVYDETFVEVPTLPEFREMIDSRLERLASEWAGLQRVEPLKEIVLSGLGGVKHVWSILYGGHTLMLMECVLVEEGRAYFLQFTAVEEDWAAYRPVFEEILNDFTVSGPSPVS